MSLSIFFSLSHEDISFLPPQCLCQRGGITASTISPKLFNFITFTDILELQIMAYMLVFWNLSAQDLKWPKNGQKSRKRSLQVMNVHVRHHKHKTIQRIQRFVSLEVHYSNVWINEIYRFKLKDEPRWWSLNPTSSIGNAVVGLVI